jgi:ABC-type multidrug transport system fused ATPase/permease subunit
MNKFEEGESTPKSHPLDEASYLSRIFFSWLSPLIRLGAQKILEDSDVPNIPVSLCSSETMARVEASWSEELQKAASLGSNPSLIFALFKAFWKPCILSVSYFLMFLIVTFIQPYCVTKILQYVNTGSVDAFGMHSGIAVAIILGCLSVIGTITFNNGFYQMQRFGLLIRSGLIASIFNKSLKLSSQSRNAHPTGDIITLMSVDVERIWLCTLLSNWVWMAPVMMTVAIILLYFEVKYPAIIVGAALIAWGYFQEMVSGWISNTRKKLVKFTSERVKLTNEVLQGIRVVKLYAWEKPSEGRINYVRGREVALLSVYLFLRMMNTVIIASLYNYCLTNLVVIILGSSICGTSCSRVHIIYDVHLVFGNINS